MYGQGLLELQGLVTPIYGEKLLEGYAHFLTWKKVHKRYLKNSFCILGCNILVNGNTNFLWI